MAPLRAATGLCCQRQRPHCIPEDTARHSFGNMLLPLVGQQFWSVLDGNKTRKRSLPSLFKGCLTGYWQATFHQRSPGVFLLSEHKSYSSCHTTPLHFRGVLWSLSWTAFPQCVRVDNSRYPAALCSARPCCPLWPWRWTSDGSGLIWVKHCTIAY